MSGTAIHWFRRDLRLNDNPALLAAAAAPDGSRRRVLGLFVLDPRLIATAGQPRLHFLHRCLGELSAATGGRLLLVRGRPERAVPAVAAHVGAAEVHVTADCMPYGVRRDRAVEQALPIPLVRTGSPYAVTPGRVLKSDGTPYAVFTPFFRAWSAHGHRSPAGPAEDLDWIAGTRLDVGDRVVVGDLDTGDGGPRLPAGGEDEAKRVWADFADDPLDRYRTDRNRPDRPGTSRLSPYLKYGCIHPRTLLADLKNHSSAGATTFRAELAWREFYADLIFHQPTALWRSVYPSIDAMQWDGGAAADDRFAAWQQGRTGYPYIDAAMRQLLADGWMHNRARMGVASFLVKDLHLPWQRGARHFLDHLVDGDVASNNMGWQWCAGAGPQAAPFYRVFNPVSQGRQHDPAGDYVRHYVPELRGITGPEVHTPWDLPDGLPDGYPERVVDHSVEREEALRRHRATTTEGR